jgi:hypothetical protein
MADRASFLRVSITDHPVIQSIMWSKRCSHQRQTNRCLSTQQAHHVQHHACQQHVIIKHRSTSFAAQITAIAVTSHSDHIIIDAATSESVEHAQLICSPNAGKWLYSTINECGCLTKGIQTHMPTGTKNMRYLSHDQLPTGPKATYARCVANERPHKKEIKCVCLAVTLSIAHEKSAPSPLIFPSSRSF